MSGGGIENDRLKSLILVRLLGAFDGMLRPEFLASLGEYLDRDDPSDAEATVLGALDDLAEDKRLEESQDLIRLKAPGRAEAMAFLGYASADEVAPWSELEHVFLAAAPLGLRKPNENEQKRFSGVDGLRAVILRKHYNLDIEEYPSLPKVRDALVWWAIGDRFGRQYNHGSDQKLDNPTVARSILSALLDSEREYEPRSSLALLAARAVGARGSDAKELRRAIVARWLSELAHPVDLGDLASFVATLHEVARTTKSGRFGANKVFISHVFRELQRRGGMDLPRETFNRCLIEAHTRDHVTLSRADLVEAMNPEDVRESEVQHQNSRFHFVRI